MYGCVIQDAWIKHPDLVSITTTTQIFLILIRKIYKRNGHFQSCLTAFIHLAWVHGGDGRWMEQWKSRRGYDMMVNDISNVKEGGA